MATRRVSRPQSTAPAEAHSRKSRPPARSVVQQAMQAVREATVMTEADYDVIEKALIQRLGTEEERGMVANGLRYGQEGLDEVRP